MSGHYFGARTVNERRRRRLALEAISALPTHPATPSRDRHASDETSPPPERTRLVTRINSLIPPSPWVSWLIVAAGTCLAAGIVWGGRGVDRARPELADILGLAAGRTTRYFMSLMLLGVSQLSFIILWYRTHSRKDFHGRYRVWIWSSLVWSLFFVSALTGLHHGITERARAAGPALSAVLSQSLWVFPASVLFLSTLRMLSKEMSNHLQGRWLLRGSGVLAAACLLTVVGPGVTTPGRLLIQRILEVSWPLLLAAAFLHHARYVIHVSNEASLVKKRRSRLSPILQQGWEELCSMLPSSESLARQLEPRRLLAIGKSFLKSTLRILVDLAKGLRPAMTWVRRTFASWMTRRTARTGSKRTRRTTAAHDAGGTEPRKSAPPAERPTGKGSPRSDRNSRSPREARAAT